MKTYALPEWVNDSVTVGIKPYTFVKYNPDKCTVHYCAIRGILLHVVNIL